MIDRWHRITDSDEFRRAIKSGPGRRLTRSPAWRRADLERNRILMRRADRSQPGLFASVRTFALFIGHNKSGTSMVGALLDAHPQIVLSDEVDALRYVAGGFTPNQIFHRLLKGSQSEARKGRVTARRLTPYSYAVPGQWQGRTLEPIAVGDGMAGTTTRLLAGDPDLIHRIYDVMKGLDIRFVQVVRNPFDPISTMMVRGNRTFRNAIDHYFAACESLSAIRDLVPSSALSMVRYEEFVEDPAGSLARICGFLGVTAGDDYLQSCSAIVKSRPDRFRQNVEWTEPLISEVNERMKEYQFLEGYSYVE